jgi:hypothetical protein
LRISSASLDEPLSLALYCGNDNKSRAVGGYIVVWERSEKQRQRDYFHLGRDLLSYYDNLDEYRHLEVAPDKPRRSGINLALGHVREQMRSGIMPMMILAVAVDLTFLAGTTTGVLVAGGHFNSILLGLGLVNLGAGYGAVRYHQMGQTLQELRADYNTGRDSLIRRNVDNYARQFASEPRGLVGQMIDRFTNSIGPAQPRLQPVRIDDGQPTYPQPRRQEMILMSESLPSAPQPTPQPAHDSGSLQRVPPAFFAIARRLDSNVARIMSKYGYSAEQALPFAARNTKMELMLTPTVAVKTVLLRFKRQRGPAVEFGLLSLATELYERTAKSTEGPSFSKVLQHFEARNAQLG